MKKRILTQNRVLAVIVISTGLVLAAGAFVLWPSYTSPDALPSLVHSSMARL